jgi:hypothetical protein
MCPLSRLLLYRSGETLSNFYFSKSPEKLDKSTIFVIQFFSVCIKSVKTAQKGLQDFGGPVQEE